MAKTRATLGAVISKLRRQRGMSQRDVEQRSRGRIKSSWLGALEIDRIVNPAQKRMALLAQILETTVLEIYREAGIIEQPFPAGISPEEQMLLNEYRKLGPEFRNMAVSLLRDLIKTETNLVFTTKVQYSSPPEKGKLKVAS